MADFKSVEGTSRSEDCEQKQRLNDQIEEVAEQIRSVERRLAAVEEDIRNLMIKIEEEADDTKREKLEKKQDYLREDKRQLWEKERQLSEKERQLREKELILLRQKPGTAGTSIAGADTFVPQAHCMEGSWLRTLLHPLPKAPSLEELKEVLHSKLAAPLPIDSSCFEILKAEGLLGILQDEYEMSFAVGVTGVAGSRFAALLSTIIHFGRGMTSEPDVRSAVDHLVTDFILLLNSLGPRPLNIDCASDARDFSGATEGCLRPDFLLWIGEQKALLFKGEDKSAWHPLQVAIDAFQRKMKRWSCVNYGPISYMLCYAAAGSNLGLGALDGFGTYTPLTRIDLATRRDRLKLTLNLINLYRVLASLEPCLPDRMISLGRVMKRPGGGCITIFDGFIEKELPPPGRLLASHETLRKVYEVTAGCSYLVTLEDWVESPKRRRNQDTGKVILRLSPLGYECVAYEEGDLRKAVQCVLWALSCLHDKGFVHRDVRWPNVLQKPDGSWFLIDLEMCAEARRQQGTWTWPAVDAGVDCSGWKNRACLERGVFTPASDLWMVAEHLIASRVLSREGQDFRDKLKSFHYPDAAAALQHQWFGQESSRR